MINPMTAFNNQLKNSKRKEGMAKINKPYKSKMRVVGKRFLCLLLSFGILSFSFHNYEFEVYAAEENVTEAGGDIGKQTEESVDELKVDKKDAKEIAEFQVQETIESGETDWKSGTKVRKVYNLYDEQKQICAYAVELKRGDKDAGYVIVGANEEHPPIIEFNTSGKFLNEKLQSDEYLLYDGNIDYYKVDKNINQASNIENETESISVDDIETEEEKPETVKEEISDEWEALMEKVKVGNSTPPESGDVNTNPAQYESGYVSTEHRIAPDAMHYQYHVMTDFGPGGICVPTAACNLLKYYVDRKRMKTSVLLNNDWNATFNRLKTYFKTIDYGPIESQGTYMENVKPGLDKYFQDIGIQDAVTHYYGCDYDDDNDTANWTEMKRRLDFGEPFVYAVASHYLYGYHAVLAVGYIQYNYSQTQASGLKSSNYLLVADGWTRLATRYINVNVGTDSSSDQMTTLYFVYSYMQK